MSRTAYHRAYYWSHISQRRASARASRRKARERAAVIKIVCEAVTEARNDKPPSGGNGGLTRLVGSLTLGMLFKRDGSVTDCSSPVKHPHTLGLSGRGNHAQIWLKSRPGRWASRRAAYCWEARTTTGKPVKSCQQRMAPSVINPHDPIEAFLRLNRADSPSVIRVLEVKHGR